MTSWEKQYSININEQRKSLNKLEEDIERELAGSLKEGFFALLIIYGNSHV